MFDRSEKRLERKYYKKPITYGDEYRRLRNKVDELTREARISFTETD